MARSGRGTLTRSVYRPIPRQAFYAQILTAAVSIAGANTKLLNKTSSGSIASSSIFESDLNLFRLFSSSIGLDSSIIKSSTKRFSGTITSNALVDDLLVLTISLLGSISTVSGDISYIPSKYFTGQLDTSSVHKFTVSAYLASSLLAAGETQKLATQVFNGYLLPQSSVDTLLSAIRLLSGSVTPSQRLSKVARKPLAGNISTSGAVRRSLSKLLSGSISMLGSLLKQRVGDINAVSAVISIETIVNITMIYEDKSIVLSIDGI